MQSFLSVPPKPCLETTRAAIETIGTCSPVNKQCQPTSAIFTGYLSDLSDDESQVEDDCDLDGNADDECHTHSSNNKISISPVPETQFQITQPLPLKHHHLDVPYHAEHQQLWDKHCCLLEKALFDVEKLIASKKMKFEAGCGVCKLFRLGQSKFTSLWSWRTNKKGWMLQSMQQRHKASLQNGVEGLWGTGFENGSTHEYYLSPNMDAMLNCSHCWKTLQSMLNCAPSFIQINGP